MAATGRRIDVDTPLGNLAIHWTAVPDSDRPVLVCIPGGTYTGAYFDLDVPEDRSYSFVEHARTAGWSTLCVDSLGTGASARPSDREVGIGDQADALSHALKSLVGDLGTTAGYIAVGHSMGGYVTMRQQARHGDYAAVAMLGTTNGAVEQLHLAPEMIAAARSREGRDALVEQIAAAMPVAYLDAGRDDMGDWFHRSDVAEHVRRADHTTLTVVPRRAAAESTVPFMFADDAATIRVPVFLAYGEIDVSASPHAEPAYFTAGDDVTLVRLPASAHCHNMAGTRHVLWDRLLGWAEHVVARSATTGGVG